MQSSTHISLCCVIIVLPSASKDFNFSVAKENFSSDSPSSVDTRLSEAVCGCILRLQYVTTPKIVQIGKFSNIMVKHCG